MGRPLNVQAGQTLAGTERAKQEVRNRTWAVLEREAAAKPPGTVVGKIPNFLGAEAAAEQLASLPVWQTAQVLKANPDKAQRAVRAKALGEGKVLYMAVPRLADELPFYLLEPERLTIPPWEAASKEGAAKAGRKVAASELRPVDLVICGSVAVNREGARVGKGGGFSDLEVAFLVEAGVLRPSTCWPPRCTRCRWWMGRSRRPSTTSASTSSPPRTRSFGAANRGGHRGSSGSICTPTRSPTFRRWPPWQPDAEQPRGGGFS